MTETVAPPSPVFVHSWWRTSSTYVWAKLRENPALRCYYKPLHEVIGHLTLEMVRFKPRPEQSRKFSHPVIERDNYAEYESLLLAGGIPFQKALSYDRYRTERVRIDGVPTGYADLAIAAGAGEKQVRVWVDADRVTTLPLGSPGEAPVSAVRALATSLASIALYALLN